MNKYKLVQMAFDGSFVTDSTHETKEGAENASANLGSKWYFYPLSIIVKGQTVIETGGVFYNIATGEPMLSKILGGKRLKTVSKLLNKASMLPDLQGAEWSEFERYLINKHLHSA